jgi:hypothetical protein
LDTCEKGHKSISRGKVGVRRDIIPIGWAGTVARARDSKPARAAAVGNFIFIFEAKSRLMLVIRRHRDIANSCRWELAV